MPSPLSAELERNSEPDQLAVIRALKPRMDQRLLLLRQTVEQRRANKLSLSELQKFVTAGEVESLALARMLAEFLAISQAEQTKRMVDTQSTMQDMRVTFVSALSALILLCVLGLVAGYGCNNSQGQTAQHSSGSEPVDAPPPRAPLMLFL